MTPADDLTTPSVVPHCWWTAQPGANAYARPASRPRGQRDVETVCSSDGRCVIITTSLTQPFSLFALASY